MRLNGFPLEKRVFVIYVHSHFLIFVFYAVGQLVLTDIAGKLHIEVIPADARARFYISRILVVVHVAESYSLEYRVLDSHPFVPAGYHYVFNLFALGFVVENAFPLRFEVRARYVRFDFAGFMVIALARSRCHIAELNGRSVLSDRNADRAVIFMDILRIIPVHPRYGVIVLYPALRPLRFDYFESVGKAFVHIVIKPCVSELVARAAVISRDTRD